MQDSVASSLDFYSSLTTTFFLIGSKLLVLQAANEQFRELVLALVTLQEKWEDLYLLPSCELF